jgi:polyisoprenoid-binding protein YceI
MTLHLPKILIALQLAALPLANLHAASDGEKISHRHADGWRLDSAASSLTFNTTKSGAAGVGGLTETMQFTALKGVLSPAGRIEFSVDLASVESGIDLRNERLRTMLWDTATHPGASFSATLNASDLKKVQEGREPVAVSLEGQLTMAGTSRPLKVELQVTPVQSRRLVNTRQPFIVNAEDFGLRPGVEALRQIMGLNYLSSSAPVSLQLDMVPVAK